MTDFSICVPTRNRPNSIKRLVKSIIDTTANLDRIEILFRIDEDDVLSPEAIDSLSNQVTIKTFVGPKKCLSDLWDDMWPHVSSPRLHMMGDDVIYRTYGWDNAILAIMPNPTEYPLFVYGNDLNQGKNIATLPIVSAKWAEILGYFVPLGYSKDYCDTHLHEIAQKVEEKGFHVMTYLNNIIFEHLHPTINKAPVDSTYSDRWAMPCGSIAFGAKAGEREIGVEQIISFLKNVAK